MTADLSTVAARKMIVYSGLDRRHRSGLRAGLRLTDTSNKPMHRGVLSLLTVLACASGAGCASSGAVPRPFPVPNAPAHGAPASTSTPAAQTPESAGIVETALALRGVPYRNGGSDPSGFDCSGFVWYVFGRHGIAVPRTVAEQFQTGRPVPGADLRPGDLVFFETSGAPVSHVGVVVSQDAFVHAPSSRGEVRVEHLAAPYWASRFAGARRLP
jgi:cell wall-associated NlpC family hydrolase